MNGFIMMADSFRYLVEQGKIDKETAEKEIRIYDFLATCDIDDFCRMVDSAAFNEIIRAFLHKAVRSAEINRKSEDRVMKELRFLFDEMPAKEVLKSYFNTQEKRTCV